MIRNLKRHEAWEAKEGFEWTQWQALQLQSLMEYRERNAELVDRAFELASPMMDDIIREAYHDGEQAFDAQHSEANAVKIQVYKDQGRLAADIPIDQLATAILDVDESGNLIWTNQAEQPIVSIKAPTLDQIPDKSFFQVNDPKLKAVLDDVHSDMDRVRYAALNRMGAGYEEIIHKADLFFQSGTMTLQQAVDMASKELLSTGLNCVEYENGRRVNIATYVEMALRTSARRAQMTAEGAKRDDWKEFLVISPALITTCPACYKYQALVMIDDVFAHGKPDGKHLLLSEAIRQGFLHPNCRHPLVTYFEGVTAVPENSPFDQTAENYEAEKRQRTIETYIRRYKRLRDGSVDPDNKEKYSLKVKQWEAMLKRHLSEHPDFRRKPEREKVNSEPMYKMDRREQNTGVFSSYPEPMQKRHVIRVANEAGINLSGITVKIQRNPHLMAKNIYGLAAGDQIGRIDLFPDAFKSKEDLIRTVFHEKIHVSQYEEYGVKFVQNNRARFETEAYEAEEAFIVNLRKEGKIG